IVKSSEIAITGEQGTLTGSFGLVPIQSWYLERSGKNVSHFNQSILLKISKEITAEVLQKALDQLITHHDALRLSFENRAGTWYQTYGTVNLKLEVDQVRADQKSDLAQTVRARVDEYQKGLSIEDGRIMRIALMQMPASEQSNRLFIAIHHLAVD